MSGHTKEPWFVADGGVCTREPIEGNVICLEPETPMRASLENWPANARRIVSCVNALAGMNPAALAALVEAAGHYFDHYLQDEAEDVDCCIDAAQHEAARAFGTSLTAFREGSAS